MEKEKQMKKTSTTITIGVLALTLALASNSDPGILPVNSSPHGQSYGKWTETWWQWALGAPSAQNPVLDTTGQFAGSVQPRSVCSLPPPFSPPSTPPLSI